MFAVRTHALLTRICSLCVHVLFRVKLYCFYDTNSVLTIFYTLLCCSVQGLLESVERDMRSMFTESPFSVYEPVMETSFGRMIVHAVTQYLGLESISESPYPCYVSTGSKVHG